MIQNTSKLKHYMKTITHVPKYIFCHKNCLKQDGFLFPCLNLILFMVMMKLIAQHSIPNVHVTCNIIIIVIHL